jgi:membrane-associated protein
MEFIDLERLIRTVGYAGLFGIVYAESGLFFGFFLPGDSLLFTAGLLAASGHLDIGLLCLVCFVAAVLGDSTGYYMGARAGPRLFTRQDSVLFHKDHLIRAQVFYDRHGGKAILLARFVPFVRTFAPIVAGVGKMNYRRFVTFNLAGGAAWGIGVPVIGYHFGSVIPDIDRYLLPIIGLIVLASVAPVLRELWKERGSLPRPTWRRRAAP